MWLVRVLEPEPPAEDWLTEDEREMIREFVERRQLRPPAERGKPLGTDIRSWVVLPARLVGWRPSKRQPYLGNEVLWRPYVRLQTPASRVTIRAIPSSVILSCSNSISA